VLGLDQPKFVSSSSGVQEQVVAGDCDGTVVSTVETSKAVRPNGLQPPQGTGVLRLGASRSLSGVHSGCCSNHMFSLGGIFQPSLDLRLNGWICRFAEPCTRDSSYQIGVCVAAQYLNELNRILV
jgi:hypothetical protein